DVADQVRPQPAMGRPHGIVDQDRHSLSIPRDPRKASAAPDIQLSAGTTAVRSGNSVIQLTTRRNGTERRRRLRRSRRHPTKAMTTAAATGAAYRRTSTGTTVDIRLSSVESSRSVAGPPVGGPPVGGAAPAAAGPAAPVPALAAAGPEAPVPAVGAADSVPEGPPAVAAP